MTADDLLLIEIALRDLRHLDVIMALDRLVMLPETEADLTAAMDDLERVKSFISDRLPERLRVPARAMFIEHGHRIETHFRAAQGQGV